MRTPPAVKPKTAGGVFMGQQTGAIEENRKIRAADAAGYGSFTI
jgi:hypothetical protein